MRKLILFTFVAFSSQALAQSVCGTILSSHRFEWYVGTLAPHELTPARVQAAGPVLQTTLVKYITEAAGPLRPGVTATYATLVLEHAVQKFNLAVATEVKGWFKSRYEHLRELERCLLNIVSAVDMESLRELTIKTARRQDVEEALALGSFIYSTNESLLRIFLLDLYQEPSRTLSFGPREMALAREALQYAHLSADDHVLQLNVDSPAVLTAMQRYLGAVNFSGVSSAGPGPAATAWAGRRNVRLAAGGLTALEALGQRGPFRVVLALDGLGEDARGLAGLGQLSALRQVLVLHGSVVMLYDYDRSPDFTEAEAVQAGFQVLSWRRERYLEPNLVDVVYGPSHAKEAGQLHAFVLRLGDEDADKRPPKLEEYR